MMRLFFMRDRFDIPVLFLPKKRRKLNWLQAVIFQLSIVARPAECRFGRVSLPCTAYQWASLPALSIKTLRQFCFYSLLLFFLFLDLTGAQAQSGPRQKISLNNNWRSIANDSDQLAYNGFEKFSFNDKNWSSVNVPHNWDAYEGYRRLRHGNRHGYAWYRKTFTVNQVTSGKKLFLFFEGVSSYATVWLNGKQVGTHAGGRTTFTLDVTDNIFTNGQQNLLAVRADHPANIKDLPWVCGGCSQERGFSEGSQPMGIFRPVHLVITNEIKIKPFGVHAWNDTTVTTKSARIQVNTELENYGKDHRKVDVLNRLLDASGKEISKISTTKLITNGEAATIEQALPVINNPRLWSTTDPYLYKLVTSVTENGRLLDEIVTPYGIRSIKWQLGKPNAANGFLLNGERVFINGIAEYEHQLGNSHAFSEAQIKTRVLQIKAAGFNAFRDAHQPHNLAYQHYWDSLGILWWTQQSAHVWYDTPEFRKNFLTLLEEWVRERRNSPSVIMWGLQNESKLPEDFAKQCTDLIRKLDPTASSQRLVSTCNGGTGTDWDVPQNWTGTYGGDPLTYGSDLKRQVLVGEYGAWRTIDLHSEAASEKDDSYSENRMTNLMETKLRLSESVRDSVAGHFMWLLTSHDNPGRVQGGEGYRELDKIGPVNYKGLLTPWEEPLDAFYMYRANYVSKFKEPMVYIVSHTWPDRWTKPGKKDNIIVYSNCDEVELFNDIDAISLGKRKRNGIGTHFTWNNVQVQYNVLYAIGYVNGKPVAKDTIVLNHLAQAPNFEKLKSKQASVLLSQKGYNYLYRVNCGGPLYKDEAGNEWLADRALENREQAFVNSLNPQWGSSSWTNDFPGMPAFFASQRKTMDPIKGTNDWKLFQSFRYGRDKLRYDFPVPDGEYLVELYFVEPWLGTGGGIDCTGWRLFDVAINDKIVLKDLDIWKTVGHDAALKKSFKVQVKGGRLFISFPGAASGQAMISAIAIATTNHKLVPAPAPVSLIQSLQIGSTGSALNWQVNDWLDTGEEIYTDDKTTLSSLPGNLYGAEYISRPVKTISEAETAGFKVGKEADIFIALDIRIADKPGWIKDYADTKTIMSDSRGHSFKIYKKRFRKGEHVLIGNNGSTLNDATTSGNFIIMAMPATTIEPAYDLKPVLSIKAVNATLNGPGIIKGQVDGKDRAIFTTASPENTVEWTFNIGAADIYSFTLSYNNPNEETQEGLLQLFSADGKLLKQETVSFVKTRAGKSNYINTTSGSMINAGNYTIRLQAKNAKELSINALDIQ